MANWLGDLMAEIAPVMEADNAAIEARKAELTERLGKLVAERDKWAAKVYKPNTNVHYARDEEATIAYGRINERRRRRRIDSLNAEIAAVEQDIYQVENGLWWPGDEG